MENDIIVKTKLEEVGKYDVKTQCVYAYNDLKKLRDAGIASKNSGVMDSYSNVVLNTAGLYNDVESFYKGVDGYYRILFGNDVENGKNEIAQSLSGIDSEDVSKALNTWNNDVRLGSTNSRLNQTEFSEKYGKNLDFSLFSQEEIERYSQSYNRGRQI